MGNRKQPFGYQMQFGTVVVQPQEAGLVQYIFQQYILGASFQELVSALRNQAVSYDSGKLWNKNMVARILENERYTGKAGYPALISSEQFETVAEKRSKKVSPSQKTEAQKLLRRLCSCNVTPGIEDQVMDLLNRVIANPALIQVSEPLQVEDAGVIGLQSKLDEALAQQPIDEDAAKHLIFQLAAMQYSDIGSEEYETERLYRLFRQAAPMEALDAALLKSTVAAVCVSGYGAVRIHLKNGQILERGTET